MSLDQPFDLTFRHAPRRHARATLVAIAGSRGTAPRGADSPGWLLRLARQWQRWRDERRTRAALAAIDGRTLHDLAMDRSEIDSVAAELAGAVHLTRMCRVRPCVGPATRRNGPALPFAQKEAPCKP